MCALSWCAQTLGLCARTDNQAPPRREQTTPSTSALQHLQDNRRDQPLQRGSTAPRRRSSARSSRSIVGSGQWLSQGGNTTQSTRVNRAQLDTTISRQGRGSSVLWDHLAVRCGWQPFLEIPGQPAGRSPRCNGSGSASTDRATWPFGQVPMGVDDCTNRRKHFLRTNQRTARYRRLSAQPQSIVLDGRLFFPTRGVLSRSCNSARPADGKWVCSD